MSYEGYIQILCRWGHYHCFDCYDEPDGDTWRCHCGSKAAWWNSVDDTNGDDVGRIELTQKTDNLFKCSCCGSENIQYKEATYEIPTEDGGE